jgi:hypothetical protein
MVRMTVPRPSGSPEIQPQSYKQLVLTLTACCKADRMSSPPTDLQKNTPKEMMTPSKQPKKRSQLQTTNGGTSDQLSRRPQHSERKPTADLRSSQLFSRLSPSLMLIQRRFKTIEHKAPINRRRSWLWLICFRAEWSPGESIGFYECVLAILWILIELFDFIGPGWDVVSGQGSISGICHSPAPF